ncbi:undecaprenyldiphospho-muramoylpentapeptide beta-N-acetylglucosaminyltransferase [Roseibacillus ishigakijimensis]|uniref:UDP-N-acetylglucosamine--N-acetylmuramyl-(pentapeptide) pyrophosphoryl-undecaprenol N-acetylglucosamine transferase n=1 Tax=Roseibacillus ishigakijimensis TaxID=454146 RepID=A0A934RNZ1_9BACT|nr:undecaprenyldiphospho-muramoylpentapeptide beta-N-acetylglucosaminyltransferase [Roseibacillus ishigakijimensis]MBK1835297.1 undecaprenyldiphospho-muramoylpentapeptide beta-N-acetylglucosaminyltransferase [Roseibacillus ishigakijimensis]
MKVVIACGGTGGHLFPGIAVAEELQNQGHEPVLVISEKKVDAEASAKYRHLRFEVLPAVAKPPTLSPRMLPFLVALVKSIGQAKALLRREKAEAVLGMGGFTSFAPCYAGNKLGLPTYVHDSNAVPGKSNIMIAKYCRQVLLGLAPAQSYFAGRETVVTGTPVRKELATLPSREEAATKWGLAADRPTLLVFGGSQGAQGLNSLVVEASGDLDCQILHVTGPTDLERVQGLVGEREGYRAIGFCDDMPAAYAIADAAICRSGASSLTELAFLGMPSLLVPYPYASDDHQTANAKVFADAGAALMAQESELDREKMAALARQLLPGSAGREELARQTRILGEGSAVEEIAKVLTA